MIATLPMYDLPWLVDANDKLWRAIARRLRWLDVPSVPEGLDREGDIDDLITSPLLLLGQTCGYPLMTDLRETVQLVATPRYRAPGCEGAMHRAAIMVRKKDPVETLEGLRGRRLAINDARSNTGMNLMRASVAPYARSSRFFDEVIATGSHLRSFMALVEDRADVASIDAVTLAHLRSHYPSEAARLRILDWTAPSPALPLVTAGSMSPQMISALRLALRDLSSDIGARAVCDDLLIDGFEVMGLARYASVLTFEKNAAAYGCTTLH